MTELQDKLQEILEQHPVTNILVAIIQFYDEPANFQPGSTGECYDEGEREIIKEELQNCMTAMLDDVDNEV
jgi:hypothetical protein